MAKPFDDIYPHLSSALFSVEKPKPDLRGKVRDIFVRGDELIMVNTDRISAFDQVLGTIPLKGSMLCEQAYFWFEQASSIVPHHVIARPDPQIMIVKKAQPLFVEVIVRGYLAGSLMREPPTTRGSLYGLSLDPGLKPYEKLPESIVTPTTKAALGEHDEAISPAEIVARNLMSQVQWEQVSEIAQELFKAASTHAQSQGLLLVDTKYEFGLINDRIHLIDEIHSSDSSRFFVADDYQEKFAVGLTPLMLDKEYLRQQMLARGFDPKGHESFVLDEALMLEVCNRYLMLTEKITGREFVAPSVGAQTRVHQVLGELLAC